jgi:hypothetical protein
MCIWTLSIILFIGSCLVVDSFWIWRTSALFRPPFSCNVLTSNLQIHLLHQASAGSSPLAINANREMSKLLETFHRNDSRSFSVALFNFSQVVKNSRLQLSSNERNQLGQMILVLVKKETSDRIFVANSMKSMVDCGFSARNVIDTQILNEIKKTYLIKKGSRLKESLLMLTALGKFGMLWKKEEEKESILQLLERTSSEKLTAGNLAEFLASISRMEIPWKALPVVCREYIKKKFVELKDEYSGKTAGTLIFAVSSLVDFNIKEIPKVWSAFLEVAKVCLEAEGFENEKEWSRFQVLSMLFIDIVLLEFVRFHILSIF